MNYKLSIIIATYNSGSTLEETIISIIEQTYKNIELIVIDGKSEDNTLDIIKKYESYISYWISEPDDGLYYAINKGIDIATGDYIEIIGSDDFFINNNIIERVMSDIEKKADIISTACFLVDEKYRLQKYYGNEQAAKKEDFKGWMIPHAGMFVKTEILKKYKFNTDYRIASDYDFFLKCYHNDEIKFKFCNYPTYYFSLSGKSSQVVNIDKENKRIRKNYNVSEEKDVMYQKILRPINMMVKNILDCLGMGRLWRMKIAKWQLHKCDNHFCRWCNHKV